MLDAIISSADFLQWCIELKTGAAKIDFSVDIMDDREQYKKNIYFAREFRLSNKDKDYLNFIYEQFKLLKNKPYGYQTIRRQLYFYNKDLTLDFLNFIFCLKKEINLKTFIKYRLFIKKFKVPKFPISGNFLIKKGFKQGKELGKKLEFLKDSWIENNFKLNLRNI